MAAIAPPSKKQGKKRARGEGSQHSGALHLLRTPCLADLASHPDLQPLSKESIKRLKVSELKEKLVEQGLETTGVKADLVERLTNALHGHDFAARAHQLHQQQQQPQALVLAQAAGSSSSAAAAAGNGGRATRSSTEPMLTGLDD